MGKVVPLALVSNDGLKITVQVTGFQPEMTVTISIGFVEAREGRRRLPRNDLYILKSAIQKTDENGQLYRAFEVSEREFSFITGSLEIIFIVCGQRLSDATQQYTLYHRISFKDLVVEIQ